MRFIDLFYLQCAVRPGVVMKILLTGNLGFIGQNLWNRLSSSHDLVGYEWDPNTLPNVKGYDVVIHLGAISSTTERDVNKILIQNLEFSQWLFAECSKHDVFLQYASSASIYGNGLNFHETAPPAPLSPYAWSKYLFDRWVVLQKHDNPVQGYRYFNVYGPHEEHKKDQASPVHKFQKQARETGKIQLFEGSDAFRRDFVFVGDLCSVHEKMLSKRINGIFNVGTGNAVSFSAVANTISEKFDAKIEIIEMPSTLKTQYQEYTCADISSLKQHIEIDWTDVHNYIRHKEK